MQKLQLAQAGLKRGCICHWEQSFGPHFAIILNLEWPPADDIVLFSIMTSSWFPEFVNNQIIRTGPEDYGFLDRPTVIDLRQVHIARLSKIVVQPRFAVKCDLLPKHVARTDEILRDSATVDQNILDLVVR